MIDNFIYDVPQGLGATGMRKIHKILEALSRSAGGTGDRSHA